jgi:Fic family protein
VTLLDGETIRGHTQEQVQQVLDFKAGADHAIALASAGDFHPTIDVFNGLHAALMSHNQPIAGRFRGDFPRPGPGPVVQLEIGEYYRAAPDDRAAAIFRDGIERLEPIQHPVVRAVTVAAFATYHQFYRDGNKRVGRYAMNAALMAHGFDAILVPQTDKETYAEALLGMYRSGRAEPYTSYLLGLWVRSQ